MKAYSDEEFKEVVMQQMPKNPLSGYIAEQVLMTQKNPNVREALRIGQLARSPEDVHRYLARVRG
jgi:hypothetical protein